ncbi:MAG: hypothetical protein ACLQNE_00510 [Thermoguttaceae bacterium]
MSSRRKTTGGEAVVIDLLPEHASHGAAAEVQARAAERAGDLHVAHRGAGRLRTAMEIGVGRAVPLVMAVVMVNQQRVTPAAGAAPLDVVDRAARQRVQQRLATVLLQQTLGRAPRLAIVAALSSKGASGGGPHYAEQPTIG